MKGKVESFVMLIVVRVVPTMVQAAKQSVEVPHMTSPQEEELKKQKQKQEVPQMTSPQEKTTEGTKARGTTNDITTRRTTEGANARGTTNDISIGKTIKGT